MFLLTTPVISEHLRNIVIYEKHSVKFYTNLDIGVLQNPKLTILLAIYPLIKIIILKNSFSVTLTDGEFFVYFEYGDSESALRISLESHDLFHLHIAYLYTLKCYVTSSHYFCLQHGRLTCSLYMNLVCHYADLINNTLTAYQEIDAGCHLKSTFLYSPLGCPNVSECRKR